MPHRSSVRKDTGGKGRGGVAGVAGFARRRGRWSFLARCTRFINQCTPRRIPHRTIPMFGHMRTKGLRLLFFGASKQFSVPFSDQCDQSSVRWTFPFVALRTYRRGLPWSVRSSWSNTQSVLERRCIIRCTKHRRGHRSSAVRAIAINDREWKPLRLGFDNPRKSSAGILASREGWITSNSVLSFTLHGAFSQHLRVAHASNLRHAPGTRAPYASWWTVPWSR